jgi:hypothetical protein
MDRDELSTFERLQLRAACLQAGATLEAALVLATHGEPSEGTYTSYDRVVAWAGNLEDWLYESEDLLQFEDDRLPEDPQRSDVRS